MNFIMIVLAILVALLVFGFFTMRVTWFRVIFFGGIAVWTYAMTYGTMGV